MPVFTPILSFGIDVIGAYIAVLIHFVAVAGKLVLVEHPAPKRPATLGGILKNTGIKWSYRGPGTCQLWRRNRPSICNQPHQEIKQSDPKPGLRRLDIGSLH